MKALDFSKKIVLITGGTRGIGLETALSFAKFGAQCVLTYRWGDHNEAQLKQAFSELKAPSPLILQADVTSNEDTDQLMKTLKQEKGFDGIDIFISNVSNALLIKSFEDYTLKGLEQSIIASSWPMVEYTKKIHATFNKFPNYVIGISSTGPDHYSYGYDFVAASKTVLEVLCRYMSYRLKANNTIINVVRSRAIKTETLNDTFGKELEDFMGQFVPENYWINAKELADAIVGLCSGYCDAIQGQTITVDKGTSFFDNYMDIYKRLNTKQVTIS